VECGSPNISLTFIKDTIISLGVTSKIRNNIIKTCDIFTGIPTSLHRPDLHILCRIPCLQASPKQHKPQAYPMFFLANKSIVGQLLPKQRKSAFVDNGYLFKFFMSMARFHYWPALPQRQLYNHLSIAVSHCIDIWHRVSCSGSCDLCPWIYSRPRIFGAHYSSHIDFCPAIWECASNTARHDEPSASVYHCWLCR